MERCTYIEIGGKNYPMRRTIAADEAIRKRFGSVNDMCRAFRDTERCAGAYVDALAILIAQGCAYKNLFEADLPAEAGAPVKDGRWIPLTAEEIAVGIEANRVGEVIDKIARAANLAKVNEVTGKPIAKKNEKAQ